MMAVAEQKQPARALLARLIAQPVAQRSSLTGRIPSQRRMLQQHQQWTVRPGTLG